MNNFLFRTKIRLHENNFNFKKLQNCNIKDNKKKIINSPYQNNIIIQKEKKIYNPIKLDEIILVFIVKNEMDLFSIKNYLIYMEKSNIQIYIKLDNKFEYIGGCLYDNIYNENLNKNKNITFTNFLITKIHINYLESDKLYYYDKDYNLKKRYNCLSLNDNCIKNEMVNIEKFKYQSFTDEYIFWFLDKIYSNKILNNLIN